MLAITRKIAVLQRSASHKDSLFNFLPHLHQPVAERPARPHVFQRAVDLSLRNLLVWTRENNCGFSFGRFEELPVADDVCHAETRESGLFGAEEFSRTAQFEIEFSDLEAVVGPN